MKFLFIVQGEGRGHMTQAISLSQKLADWGHTLVAVCIGKSERREVPPFVHQKITAPIYLFESPNFVTDRGQKSILLGKTISRNLAHLPKFRKSLALLDEQVKKYQPDVILNFYDMLAGFYNLLYRPQCRFWVIGHQYLIRHPEFPFAIGDPLGKFLFRLNTAITAFGADKTISLSFRKYAPLSKQDFHVVPPLLRRELEGLQSTHGDFFLAYMVNPGYGEEIISFAQKNPKVRIEAFWDNRSQPDGYSPSPNLVFHQVSDSLFLEKMAQCRGLVTTAGFESICEAMYLGKPVMMIPVKGQYEQACNALDAENCGAGFAHTEFDFLKFSNELDRNWSPNPKSKEWFGQFDGLFTQLLESDRKETKTKTGAESLSRSH